MSSSRDLNQAGSGVILPARAPGVMDHAAASIAHLVDEFTDRGWNEEGRAKFAAIIKRRLSRFPAIAAGPDLLHAARELSAVLSRFGEWEDGCFYYNGTTASELEGPQQALADAIAKALGPSAPDTTEPQASPGMAPK